MREPITRPKLRQERPGWMLKPGSRAAHRRGYKCFTLTRFWETLDELRLRDGITRTDKEKSMTILERFLGHDAWTTRQLLLRCRELSGEQLSQKFDIGDRSLHQTFEHVIAAMETHTDYLLGRPTPASPRDEASLDALLIRLTVVAKEFSEFAIRVEREGRADEMVTNPKNGKRRTLGGVIAHIITHGMHHRAQILFMMEHLGLQDVIEGDPLGWEAMARGWGWQDGGSDGKMIAD